MLLVLSGDRAPIAERYTDYLSQSGNRRLCRFLRLRHQQRHREAGCRSRGVEFAPDSPLEGVDSNFPSRARSAARGPFSLPIDI